MSLSILSSSLPTAADYSSFPDTTAIHGIFDDQNEFVAIVQELQLKHNVSGQVLLLALHKHHEVAPNHVLLLEHVNLPNDELGEIVHPVPAKFLGEYHPVAFFVKGDVLQPFKYAPGLGKDMSTLLPFFEDYVALAKAHKVDHLFALMLPNVSGGREMMVETELPSLSSVLNLPMGCYFDLNHVATAAVGGKKVADCEKNQTHALTVRNTHQVFIGTALGRHYRDIYDAAVAVIDTFFMAAHEVKMENIAMTYTGFPRPVLAA